MPQVAQRLANAPAQPVATDGTAGLPPHRDTDPGLPAPGAPHINNSELTCISPAFAVRQPVVLCGRQPADWHTAVCAPVRYTVKRQRPLAIRRLRTRRPPVLRIRARNPCVRRRFRTFGWYVRFTSLLHRSGLARIASAASPRVPRLLRVANSPHYNTDARPRTPMFSLRRAAVGLVWTTCTQPSCSSTNFPEQSCGRRVRTSPETPPADPRNATPSWYSTLSTEFFTGVDKCVPLASRAGFAHSRSAGTLSSIHELPCTLPGLIHNRGHRLRIHGLSRNAALRARADRSLPRGG